MNNVRSSARPRSCYLNRKLQLQLFAASFSNVVRSLGMAVTLLAVLLSNTHSAEFEVEGFNIEQVTTGLSLPTSIAFHPDGRIFIAQKNGVVRVFENGVLLDTPFVELDDVNTYGDRGLIGIAFDPNVQSNNYIYLAYTYENDSSNRGGPKTARVVRLTANGNTALSASLIVILGSVGGSPSSPSCNDFPIDADCIPSDSISHSIGGLRFGPDGKLYVAIGDGADFDGVDVNAFRAQDLETLSGKLLRVETNGEAVSDNPFFTGNATDNTSKIWANGFRNPYRFNFHPDDGRILGGDVGWSNREEINHVVAGGNYGWPCREGSIPTTGYAGLPACDLNYGVSEPIYDYAHVNNSGAITGGVIANSPKYPSWFRGRYVFADFAFGTLRYLTLNAQSQVLNTTDLASDIDGPVEIVTGPDGIIYYLSISRGELSRLIYTGNSRNQPPVASVSYINSIEAPLTVSYSSTGSSDPYGNTLQYLWQFGDGISSTEANPIHTYAVSGTYQVTLSVSSQSGLTSSTSVTVVVETTTVIDSQPFLISLTSETNPKFVGSLISFRAVFGNRSSGNAFTARFELLNRDGDVVESIELEPIELSFGQTADREFSWLPDSPDTYNVRLSFLRANSNTLIQPVEENVASLDVVSRSAVSSTGTGVFSLTYLNALFLLLVTQLIGTQSRRSKFEIIEDNV